ncbi:MAG: glycine zipper domain-containing protein [Pseudomonadota bacterium]
MRQIWKWAGILGLMVSAGVAQAADMGSILGGGLGGAVGAAVGANMGGQQGAIIGGAIGGAAGAAVGSSYDRRRYEPRPVVVPAAYPVYPYAYRADNGRHLGWYKNRHRHGRW